MNKVEKVENKCTGCLYYNEGHCMSLKVCVGWDGYVPEKDIMVYNVSHYNEGKVEAIDIMDQACEGLTGVEGGYIFTVLRYLLRWKHKGGIQDLRKAHNYLGRLINILDKGEHKWNEPNQ